MYPTIYHVFYDWFGWEIPFFKLLNSFGFFVAVAFVAASWVLGKELKRKEEGGLFKPEKRKVILGKPVQWSDVIINAFIGFIMGWKIVWLIMNAGDLFVPGTMPQEHIFSMAGYPLMGLLFAALLGGWKWFDYHSKRLPEPQEKVVLFHAWEYTGSITMIAAIFGIVGAKFFHLFENPAEFMNSSRIQLLTIFSVDSPSLAASSWLLLLWEYLPGEKIYPYSTWATRWHHRLCLPTELDASAVKLVAMVIGES